MRDLSGLAPWRQPGWLEAVTDWSDAGLAAAGLARNGPIIPRERAWSIVLEIPTTGGPFFFKETAAALANDAALTALLAPMAPDVVLTPLAVDLSARRMLLPHGGERLRDLLDRAPDAGHWERILPRYAQLQRKSAAAVGSLRDAGAFDRRLGRLPRLLDALLADPAPGHDGHAPGLSSDHLAALRALVPAVRVAAGQLAEIGIPIGIQHDDFHDGNILATESGGYRFVDWGDAQVGHPFGTLLITIRSAADRFAVAEDGPEMDRLRDAYLEVWSDLAPLRALRRAAELSGWLAMIGRAAVWRVVCDLVPAGERDEWIGGVVRWLSDLAAGPPGEDSAGR